MQPNGNIPGAGQPVGPTSPVSSARPMRSAMPTGGPTFDNGPSVVKEKGGKRVGWILAVVLLLIVAIGGVGFGVWAMMDGNAQKDALNSQISNLKQQNNELQDKLDNGSNTIIDIDTDADVWSSFSNGLAQNSMITEGEYWSYNGTENVHHQLTAIKNTDGHLVIMTEGNETLLEIDDVIASYFVHIGNGADAHFYIIKNDGSVYRFGTPETSNELEKIGDYTKIATVFQEGDLGVVLVDIYGNSYKIR